MSSNLNRPLSDTELREIYYTMGKGQLIEILIEKHHELRMLRIETNVELSVLTNRKSFSWEEVEEFGRKAFYNGREYDEVNDGLAVFKRPTYNGYLREIDAD